MKLMYWPNEPARLYPQGQQFGARAAFAEALRDGEIDALEIFSFLREKHEAGTMDALIQRAVERTHAFSPDVILVQHVTGSGVPESLWTQVRDAAPTATLIYHEDDPFDRWAKRIDAPMQAILAHADLVYTCGMGSFMELLGRHTPAQIRFLIHNVQSARFAQNDPRTVAKQYDIAMIANRGTRRRLKFAYLPGGRRRARFAERLDALYGHRFALYGQGWDRLVGARGTLPFEDQEVAIQRARISVNWDHFDTVPYYFSNRLPISLAAGVPHVTTWHPGFDNLFSNCPGLYTCRSVDEAIDTCRWLLTRSDEDLIAEGLAGRHWVAQNLEATRVFRQALADMTHFAQARRNRE